MSSTLLLHAQENRRGDAIETLADDLVEALGATLSDRKNTSVAVRPLTWDPERLSRLPDDILRDLDSELFDLLRREFLNAHMEVKTRRNLMNAYDTRREHSDSDELSYEEELLRAGAAVEVYCNASWTVHDMYNIKLDCQAVQLQERIENKIAETAANRANARESVPIQKHEVFDVVIADLAAEIVEQLAFSESDLRAVELDHAEFTGDTRSTALRGRMERQLGSAVHMRIQRQYQWGTDRPIGAGDQEVEASKYKLHGLVTCLPTGIELEVRMLEMKDGQTRDGVSRAYKALTLPVEILPAGVRCADAMQAPLGIKVKNPSRVYDGSDDLKFTVTGLRDGDTAAQVLNGSLSRASGSDVGAYAISFGTLAVTSAFTPKYVLPEASTLGSYTITPKEVTVDSAVLTKEYDGAPGLSGAQLIGGEVSGAVSGQSLTLSVTGGSYATVDVATGITISSPTFGVVAGLNTNQDNYALPSSIDLTGTITKKATTFIGTAVSRAYDGTDAVSSAISGTFTPKLLGGDVVTISGGTYGSADAGMNIPISGATVGGVDAGNYAVTLGAISGAITARTITVIDGVTVVPGTVDGATANFDTTQATGTGVLASELADFRAGGLVMKEFLTADAGTRDVSVSYTLTNSGRFKAGNYELGGGVGTGTLALPLLAYLSPLQMEPPPQPYEARRPVARHLPSREPTSLELGIDATQDDEAYGRARAENTVESYAEYLRRYPNGRHETEAWGGVFAAAPTIGVNDERMGALTDPLTSDDDSMDVWTLRGGPGTELHVDMVTDEFDAVLYAMGEEIELWDDDSGGGTNARLELTLPPSGEVIIIASAFDSSSRGQYVLRTRTAAAARDDEAYERARAEHTVESYWEYLRSFPGGRHQDEAWAEVYAGSPKIGVNEERVGALTGDLIHPETDAPVQVWTLHGDGGTGLYVDMLTDEFDAYLLAWDDTTGERSDLDWVEGMNAGTLLLIPSLGTITLIAGASDTTANGDYLLRTRTFPTIGVNEERNGSLSADFVHPETQIPIEAWTLRGEAGTVLYVDMLTDLFDAVLLAWDSDNYQITDGDLVEGLNARVELTIPHDGVAILSASASGWSAGLRGGYLLRTRTPEEEARLAQEAAQDDEAHRRAKSVGTAASYEQYLTDYPNGRHADEARRLMAEARDDEAYERARAADTSSAYQAYLRRYANGRHVDDARRMHAAALSREESRPGRRFQDCDDCPLMVVVPPGSYMMGTPASESRWERDEAPQHIVTIGYALAVGVYEITRGEYRIFAASTGHPETSACWRWNGKWSRYGGTNWSNTGYPQTDRDPVVCVSWEDAMEYVHWLSRETGEDYRLLSEAEWEYVARGGTNTARYWGWGVEPAESQCRYANGADTTLRAKDRHQDWRWEITYCDDGYHRTSPAGSYEENGYGLHDVLGNVWEWTHDCKSENYEGAPSDGSAWEREGCDRRVMRGGSWSDTSDVIRAANRGWADTDHRNYTVGFRVVRTI